MNEFKSLESLVLGGSYLVVGHVGCMTQPL